jgi:hypothetical protein
MKTMILIAGAAALAFAPALSAQSAPANGNSGHTHSGNAAGQPGADCEMLVETQQGATPGNATSAPGSAFNPDGNAGKHYAGEQPQNSRNSASVSQYDSACRDTPRSPQ